MATKVSYDQSALHMAGLVILLERAGGSLTFTEAEYQRAVARHGGRTMIVVHAEVIKRAGTDKPDEVRLTLTRKPPGNAKLPA